MVPAPETNAADIAVRSLGSSGPNTILAAVENAGRLFQINQRQPSRYKHPPAVTLSRE